jgi:hypothetical protein
VEITKTPGMLLSISSELDLSHTSILYYYHDIICQRNTKLSKQTDKKIAIDSTTMKNEVGLGLGG